MISIYTLRWKACDSVQWTQWWPENTFIEIHLTYETYKVMFKHHLKLLVFQLLVVISLKNKPLCIRFWIGYFLILFVFTIKFFSLFISVPHFCNPHWLELYVDMVVIRFIRDYIQNYEKLRFDYQVSFYQGPADRSTVELLRS